MDQRTKTRETSERPMPDACLGVAREAIALISKRSLPQATVHIRVLDKLIIHVLTRGLFDAERVASMLRSQRFNDLEALHSYIPAAARRLGKMWSEDIISFAEVTIGTARLQALSHEISGRWDTESDRLAHQRLTLTIATMAEEDHTLGAVTVCAMLRRQGHNVEIRLGADAKDLIAILEKAQHDALLLSCSRPEGLASLASAIKDIRSQLKDPPVLAVGGVVLDHAADIKEKTGADLVARDVYPVLKLATSFRKGRIALVS